MGFLSACTVASHRDDNKSSGVVTEGDEPETMLRSMSFTPAGGSGKQSAMFFVSVSADYLTSFRIVGDSTTKRTTRRSGPRSLYQRGDDPSEGQEAPLGTEPD
jgi:hypothetical protein